jgi:hypothetical protein
VYVPEPRRATIKPRVQAQIFVDGVKQPLAGFVRWVASDAAFTPYFALTQRDRSRLAFLAEVEVTDPRVRELPAGVPVEVRIDATAPPGAPAQARTEPVVPSARQRDAAVATVGPSSDHE